MNIRANLYLFCHIILIYNQKKSISTLKRRLTSAKRLNRKEKEQIVKEKKKELKKRMF